MVKTFAACVICAVLTLPLAAQVSSLVPGAAYDQVYRWLVSATLSSACSPDSQGTWTCDFTRSNGLESEFHHQLQRSLCLHTVSRSFRSSDARVERTSDTGWV
jgi:hypothetical protein